VLHDDQNRVIVNLLELVFDTGMDADSAPLPVPLIDEVIPAPLYLTGTFATGSVGVAYSSALTISGGVPPYSNRTIVSGSLPAGLAIGSGAADELLVEGTPT
jgi:hypothetical protein